jgi:hypothetical protein
MRLFLTLTALAALVAGSAIALDAAGGNAAQDTIIVTRGTKSEVTSVNKAAKGDVIIDPSVAGNASPGSPDQPAPKPIVTTR